jgi:hypothetical protein
MAAGTARHRIVVPQRPIQGGFDMKFETDPYAINLKGIMTSEQYTDTMTSINDRLRPSRSGLIDKALLCAGPLLVPLALWGVRHSNQNRRRKRLLTKSIEEFNTRNPALTMRWNRRPQSCLTIERREIDGAQQPMAEAQLVPGLVYADAEDIPVESNATRGSDLANNGLV